MIYSVIFLEINYDTIYYIDLLSYDIKKYAKIKAIANYYRFFIYMDKKVTNYPYIPKTENIILVFLGRLISLLLIFMDKFNLHKNKVIITKK